MSTQDMQTPDPLQGLHFLFSDYGATGEGRRVSMMIAPLLPRERDWEVRPGFQPGQGYVAGELATPVELILLRQFAETFDSWQARGMQIVDAAKFAELAGPFLPPAVLSILDRGAFGAFSYTAQVHVNYS